MTDTAPKGLPLSGEEIADRLLVAACRTMGNQRREITILAKQRDRALTAEREANAAERREREAKLTEAENALTAKGYRRTCDIPACNCGDSWAHGGRADERLREISDALGEHRQGRTLLGAVETLVAAEARLTKLTTALLTAKAWGGSLMPVDLQNTIDEALADPSPTEGGIAQQSSKKD